MLLLLRLISANLVAALPFDETRRHHHGRRSLHRKKRRSFAYEDLFFGAAPSGARSLAIKKRNSHPVQMLNPKRLSHNVVASSSKPSKSNGVKSIECDPQAGAKPDVGILSCAKGSHCVPSDESALGGICTFVTKQQRLLQGGSAFFEEYCTGKENYYVESCDCSELVNGIGPVSCTIESRFCYDVAENYCSSLTAEGEVSFSEHKSPLDCYCFFHL